MARLKLDTDQFQVSFSGNKGFHLTVPCQVFAPSPSRITLELYKKMAINAQNQGVPFVDTSVYNCRRLWRLVNSVNSKSNLYKIPLTYKELLNLSAESIMKLAQKPRCEDSFCIARPNQHAINWYKNALYSMARLKGKKQRNKKQVSPCFKNGWRIPPCIKNIQQSILLDGFRHESYLTLARFYSWIKMHPDEITERLLELDKKNPIGKTDDIHRITIWATDRPGFAGCDNDVLKKYCDKKNCFYFKQKKRVRNDT